MPQTENKGIIPSFIMSSFRKTSATTISQTKEKVRAVSHFTPHFHTRHNYR